MHAKVFDTIIYTAVLTATLKMLAVLAALTTASLLDRVVAWMGDSCDEGDQPVSRTRH